VTIKYSVLDQSIAVAGEPQGQAIRNTVELASFCEGLGYERFWVSEALFIFGVDMS
jgi:alkanesulfonate monooxygenase SsuD/methylene tetrahydromethanopterin reductase-like flavin-dependent oxidoreductase (luciferase family)